MIGIIILNYNNWELTVECIRNIELNTTALYRIYVVDNHSSEVPSKALMDSITNDDKVILIHSNKNGGYAAGNNLGVQYAFKDNCDEILITNNDVVFENNSIDQLQAVLMNDNEIGIVGPMVFTPTGKIQEINMACKMTMLGKYLYILRKTPLKIIGRSFVNRFHANNIDKTKPFYVYAVSGCCFMVSKDCSRVLFPLDEGTFMYEEENIIGIKMESKGYKTLYYSPCHITHLGGASVDSMSGSSYLIYVNSELYYCKKYLKANVFQVLPLYLSRMFVYANNYGVNNVPEFYRETHHRLYTNYRRDSYE